MCRRAAWHSPCRGWQKKALQNPDRPNLYLLFGPTRAWHDCKTSWHLWQLYTQSDWCAWLTHDLWSFLLKWAISQTQSHLEILSVQHYQACSKHKMASTNSKQNAISSHCCVCWNEFYKISDRTPPVFSPPMSKFQNKYKIVYQLCVVYFRKLIFFSFDFHDCISSGRNLLAFSLSSIEILWHFVHSKILFYKV